MADCIAEVDDVSAGLDAEEGEALPAVPAAAPIPENRNGTTVCLNFA